MLSHLSLGVSDMQRSRVFYTTVLGAMGFVEVWSYPDAVGYGPPDGNDKLALFERPEAEVPLAAGPGFHLALQAPSREAVHAFHAAALEAGGRCDGPPGLRPHYGERYYAAFVLDPDGHKLEAVYQL